MYCIKPSTNFIHTCFTKEYSTKYSNLKKTNNPIILSLALGQSCNVHVYYINDHRIHSLVYNLFHSLSSNSMMIILLIRLLLKDAVQIGAIRSISLNRCIYQGNSIYLLIINSSKNISQSGQKSTSVRHPFSQSLGNYWWQANLWLLGNISFHHSHHPQFSISIAEFCGKSVANIDVFIKWSWPRVSKGSQPKAFDFVCSAPFY